MVSNLNFISFSQYAGQNFDFVKEPTLKESVARIFSYLNEHDLRVTSRVSKGWLDVASKEWKRRCNQENNIMRVEQMSFEVLALNAYPLLEQLSDNTLADKSFYEAFVEMDFINFFKTCLMQLDLPCFFIGGEDVDRELYIPFLIQGFSDPNLVSECKTAMKHILILEQSRQKFLETLMQHLIGLGDESLICLATQFINDTGSRLGEDFGPYIIELCEDGNFFCAGKLLAISPAVCCKLATKPEFNELLIDVLEAVIERDSTTHAACSLISWLDSNEQQQLFYNKIFEKQQKRNSI